MSNTKRNLVRIDDRLIHGQIVVGWANHIKPKYIILVDDEIASDIFEKELYLMGVPDEFEGLVFSIRECSSFVKKNKKDSYIIVIKSPEIAYNLFKYGLEFESLNIGGMHSNEGKKEFNRFVYVDKNDIKYLKLLAKEKSSEIEIYIQDLPFEKRVSLNKLLEKFENE